MMIKELKFMENCRQNRPVAVNAYWYQDILSSTKNKNTAVEFINKKKSSAS